MKNFLCVLSGIFFLSVACLPEARGESRFLPDLDDIYWQAEAPFHFFFQTKPMIAIVIDDMGVDRKRSVRAVKNLDAAVTMSYLTYARHVQEQVLEAKALGHEVILHLPWESDRETANPGPNHLSVGMTKEQLQKNMLANLDGFTGYSGINNHMGSKFSRHRPGLEVVMEEIKKRGVFFLDSKTTDESIAGKVSEESGIPTLYRDVFLDHVETSSAVSKGLKEVERIARKKGYAVIIGHPKDISLSALEAWIPSIRARGFELVPLSTLLERRQDTHISMANDASSENAK